MATDDPRDLIAEGLRQEEAFDNPASTVEYGRAQIWIRANLAALLAGYSAALDEIDAMHATLNKLMHRISVTDFPPDAWKELEELEALARRQADELVAVAAQRDSWQRQASDNTAAGYRIHGDRERMRAALRKIHDDAMYDQNHERYREIADILDERTPCTTTK